MVHATSAPAMPRSAAMSGRARFTAEMSRITISCATRSVPSRAGRNLPLEACVGGCVVMGVPFVSQTDMSDLLNQTRLSDVKASTESSHAGLQHAAGDGEELLTDVLYLDAVARGREFGTAGVPRCGSWRSAALSRRFSARPVAALPAPSARLP